MKMFYAMLLSSWTVVLSAAENPRIFFSSGGEPMEKADILTGFVEPVSLQPAAETSEAKLLYDDNALFLEFTGFHPAGKKPQKKVSGKSIFSADHMEFFIQPDPKSDAYYHIAATPYGDLYTAKKKDTGWKNRVKVSVSDGETFGRVKLEIPFADLGAKPSDGMKIRFNVCRDVRAGDKRFASAFAPLPTESFHLPETWRDAVLCRKPEPPARFETKAPLHDLFSNSEFNRAKNNLPEDWILGRDAIRQETMALSGEWIIHCSGNAYAAIHREIKNLSPGKEYTLRVRARKFGNDVSMGVLLLTLKPDGDFKGVYPALVWKHPLTDEFKEYLFTFKAPEKLARIVFYRLADKPDNTNGVDYAAISLFEGRLSPFSIRSFSFFKAGLKRGVPGTGPARPDNLYGKRAEKLRILGIVRSLRISYDLLDIFAGLNVDLDQLAITGTTWAVTPDIYFTDSPPETVEKRIRGNEYDLYVISGYSASRLGPELLKMLRKNLESGCGIWVNNNAPERDFEILTGGKAPSPVEEENPAVPFRELRIGKGRIVFTGTGDEFEVPLPPGALPWETARCRAQLARLVCRASGIARLIHNPTVRNGSFSFRTEKDMNFRWRCADGTGRTVAEGTGKTRNHAAEVSFPPSVFTGEHVLHLWLVDGQGNTVDYTDKKFVNPGPAILSCNGDRDSYTGNGPAVFTVKNVSLRPGLDLSWTLSDWSGRILESGRVPAASENRFSVPLGAVYTNGARLRVSLREKDTEIARHETGVLVADRDRKRQWNDFTVSNWNSSMAPERYASQLEYIGIGNCLRPSFDIERMFSYGIGVCGDDRGGTAFYPQMPPEANIRRPSLNDPAVMEKIEERCRRLAGKERKYGLVFASVIDEAGLSSRQWPLDSGEVDAHPENLREYRKRMHAKYGTIDRFNTQCGTAYRNFDELKPVLTSDARKRSNYAEFIEWRNFNSDRWTEAIARLGQVSREEDSGMPLCLYNSFGPRGTGGNDYWKLLTRGNIGFSLEYTSQVYPGMRNPLYDFDELYRSFRPDMRLWGFIGYYWSRELALFQPWWYALHRYGGFCWFGMTSTDGGGTLLETPGLNITREAELLREGVAESGLLDGFGKLFLEYPWAPRDIAVLYSHNSMLTAWCRGTEPDNDILLKGSPYYDWHFARYGLRYLLEDLLYQYDFISPEQLENGTMGKRKVLFMPQATALSDASVKATSRFLENGGWVIADTMPGNWTELGARRKDNPFEAFRNHPRFIVTGKPFDELDPECRAGLLKHLRTTGAEPVLSSPDVPRLTGREAMCFSRDGLNVFAVTRNPNRSNDTSKQTFIFPEQAHVYNLRTGKYLGKRSEITLEIPAGETVLLGQYPCRVTALEVDMPSHAKAGTDLKAGISIRTDGGKAGCRLFHIEVLPPGKNTVRRLMTRNETAPNGRLDFTFRMAQNDPPGTWKLRVKDILTGTAAEKNFELCQPSKGKEE
ncbi:MAG: hypothetical protein BWY31_03475 [Lentisphaerae bacterium ADurb.Bin242]|nr:MAG: hypothetical protein BWY31_03475 [Lentisphaerae bacterium ADurb.Bin242]